MAEGQIGSILDTLICNSDTSGAPSVAHVYGDIYVICWGVGGTDGYICTVDIAADGTIEDSVIETLHFESSVCINPHIVNMGGNIFAYAYEYGLTHGIVRTVQIANDGNIVGGNIDWLEFEIDVCHEPDICKVGDGCALVVYRDTNNDGKIVTFSIAGNGSIGDAVSDEWVFDPATVIWPNARKISPGCFAFFFTDGADDGWVKTIAISGSGVITESIIDSLRFEISSAFFIHTCHFTGNIYAAVYEDSLGHGWVTTMVINSGGTVGGAYADRFNFNTGYGQKPTIIGVTSNVLAVAYVDSASSGEIYTFWCLSDGDITTAPVDELAFDTTLAGYPHIFSIGGGIFAVAYPGEDSYITVKTFDIKTVGIPKHLPMMGIG